MTRWIAVLLFAFPLFAGDAASIAMLVKSDPFDAKPIVAALRDADALTRATAARVLTIRGGDVASLRAVLENEKDAEVARELVRAITLLGNQDDIAFVAAQLPRFPASLHAEFVEMLGRRGAPEAIDLYLQYRGTLRDVSAPTLFALWGRTGAIIPTTSRLIGAKDTKGFAAVLDNAIGAGIAAPAGAIVAALAANDPDLRRIALWYVVDAYSPDPKQMPEAIRTAALADHESGSPSEAFAREILKRMHGGARATNDVFLAWLRDSHRKFSNATEAFLTLEEKNALKPDVKILNAQPIADPIPTEAVRNAAFSLPIKLPRGLGEAILKRTRCADAWTGVVNATVDRTGRVQSVDLSHVYAMRACKSALDTMLSLSFAVPAAITAPLTTPDLQVVRGTQNLCFNDDSILMTKQGFVHQIGDDVTAPVIVRRVEPAFPAEVRRTMTSSVVRVIAESVITREGCVRDVRILGQSNEPVLNSTAAAALSNWTFKPGTLHGEPVDVRFYLTVNFKLR